MSCRLFFRINIECRADTEHFSIESEQDMGENSISEGMLPQRVPLSVAAVASLGSRGGFCRKSLKNNKLPPPPLIILGR